MTLFKECINDNGVPFILSLETYGRAVDVVKRLGFLSENDMARSERLKKSLESLRAFKERKAVEEKQLEFAIWGEDSPRIV